MRFPERGDERCYRGQPEEDLGMAKERTSVRMQAQIRRMFEQGYSIHAIARILMISREAGGQAFTFRIGLNT